jgi:hypothetical protein
MVSPPVASLSVWLVAMPRYGLAQATSASVNGTVRDQSSALLSDVPIVLANVDTGVQRTGATGSAGVYSLGGLTRVDHSAQASKDGFANKKTGIVLQVNQTATPDFTLTVGLQKETVTVASKLSLVGSLFRRFPIRDKAIPTLRIEAFNAFNAVVFAAAGRVINGPNFGVVTSTANQPGQVHVALKLVY